MGARNLCLLVSLLACQGAFATRLNHRAKAAANSTMSCPANVEISTKGDCIDADTLQPAPETCCDYIKKCQDDVVLMLNYVSDRLNQYLATCRLGQQDFGMGPGGVMELLARSLGKVCHDDCVGMEIIDYEEVLGRCRTVVFEKAQQLESLGSAVNSIDEARKSCSAATPSPVDTNEPTPFPTPAPPHEYWSGTCSACPSSFHPSLHCKGPAKQIGERGCGVKVFGLHLGCEAKCREPEQTEFWNGRCTFCPASWYAHCPSGSKLVGERGCGVGNVFCEGKCRVVDLEAAS